MKVAVCICTYLRPRGLEQTLTGLNALQFSHASPQIKIIVVDNDHEQSARQVCASAAQQSSWPIEYYVEPQRGIPSARNACIRHASNAELIAFIDDDETPSPTWLERLIDTLKKHDADAATGPVIRRLPKETPDWIHRGRFFEAASWKDGTIVNRAFTNNVVFRARALVEFSPWFDERMLLTGGSDTHFFQRFHAAGIRSSGPPTP